MKFSSVSLIAAALAGIAGTAVAAPLHAHALEAVNSFEERDLDVYSGLALLERKVDDDSLFTRADISPEEGARLLAKANRVAKKARSAAILDNRRAYEVTGDFSFQIEADKHYPKANEHRSLVLQHKKDQRAIAGEIATPSQIKRSENHKAGVRKAKASERSAKASSSKALAAIEKHEDEAAQVHEDAQILHEAAKHAAKHEAAQVLHNMKAG